MPWAYLLITDSRDESDCIVEDEAETQNPRKSCFFGETDKRFVGLEPAEGIQSFRRLHTAGRQAVIMNNFADMNTYKMTGR
jgi:hypothetical protein